MKQLPNLEPLINVKVTVPEKKRTLLELLVTVVAVWLIIIRIKFRMLRMHWRHYWFMRRSKRFLELTNKREQRVQDNQRTGTPRRR